MFLDATQFDDAYLYGYYDHELPKMHQISTFYMPVSPYFYDISKFGEVISVIPCSDGIVYIVKLPDSSKKDKELVADGPTAPRYPETPKGANGPDRPA